MNTLTRIGRLRVLRGAARLVGSESRQEPRYRDFEHCGEAHQNVQRDILLTTLHLTEVVRMNVGFLRKLLLRKSRCFPRISESVTKDFPVFRTSWHSQERQQPARISTTVYSLYFARRSRPPRGRTSQRSFTSVMQQLLNQ